MAYKFNAGLIKVDGTDDQPDWKGVAARLNFASNVFGLHIKTMPAIRNSSGGWDVPFLTANEEGSEEPSDTIGKSCGYCVSNYKRIDVAKVGVDCLRELEQIVSDEPRTIRPTDFEQAESPDLSANPAAAFDGLIGLTPQRDQLMKVANLVAKRGPGVIDSMHMVFYGNPGTGKTEFASRFCSYTDAIGVTDGSHRFVKAGEADIIARYVGHTAPKVKALVARALGGVLFIDEFYSVASCPHFGQEAVDALVDQLDAHRHEFVCIVAGYEEDLEDVFAMNPGLRDRFGFRVEFPDYSDDELWQIFCGFLGKKGFATSEDVRRPFDRALASMRAGRGFSNARSVRRLADRCAMEAAWVRDEPLITAADLASVAAQKDMRGPARPAVGFC